MTVAKVILVDKAVITRLAYDHVEIAIEDETGHLHISKCGNEAFEHPTISKRV